MPAWRSVDSAGSADCIWAALSGSKASNHIDPVRDRIIICIQGA